MKQVVVLTSVQPSGAQYRKAILAQLAELVVQPVKSCLSVC